MILLETLGIGLTIYGVMMIRMAQDSYHRQKIMDDIS